MEWMLDVLKELAEKYKPQLVEKVREELRGFHPRYLRMFDYVYKEFYSEVVLGRWYDPYHISQATLFTVQLVKRKEAPEINIVKAIGHDNGYRLLADKEAWTSSHSRILHQQEGAAVMAELLAESKEFSANEIGRVVRDVGKHDNGYLGILAQDPELLALIDADRAWVMHPLSFYKDWLSKIGKGEDLSLLELFQSRLTSFYGYREVYPSEWGKIEKPDKEDAVQFPPFTKLAREWRDRQFKARFQEIQNSIARDAAIFRKTITSHIETELKAGRG